jgi:hypothetical protein
MLQYTAKAQPAPVHQHPTPIAGAIATNPPPSPMQVAPSVALGEDDSIQSVFGQLAHALTVLSSVADLMLANKQPGSPAGLCTWLQPNARQAEAAMRSLRKLQMGPTHAMTELSHCLTILVLAADMLSKGQLSEADAYECYELLRRNANRAVTGLDELHVQINTDAMVEPQDPDPRTTNDQRPPAIDHPPPAIDF